MCIRDRPHPIPPPGVASFAVRSATAWPRERAARGGERERRGLRLSAPVIGHRGEGGARTVLRLSCCRTRAAEASLQPTSSAGR
eukprot:4175234-Prymnesium_polylepis.1